MHGVRTKRISVPTLFIFCFGVLAVGKTALFPSPAEHRLSAASASLRPVETARVIPPPPPDQVVVQCGPPSNSGDGISNYGFYVPSLPADRLERVELNLISWTVGEFRIALEARSEAFDGPLVGIAIATVNFPSSNAVVVPFDFHAAPVIRDQRVTFKFSLPDGEIPSSSSMSVPVLQTRLATLAGDGSSKLRGHCHPSAASREIACTPPSMPRPAR